MKNDTLSNLLTAAEKQLGFHPDTPRDFRVASEAIDASVNVKVSATTLMRLWGYLDERVAPSMNTLNAVARYLGCANFEQWCLTAGGDSDTAAGKRLDLKTLQIGDRLRLHWQPNRVMEVEYQGERHFKVLHAENTRLFKDNEFDCGLFINGETLYLDNVEQHNGQPKRVYVCGQNHGVSIERISASSQQP